MLQMNIGNNSCEAIIPLILFFEQRIRPKVEIYISDFIRPSEGHMSLHEANMNILIKFKIPCYVFVLKSLPFYVITI